MLYMLMIIQFINRVQHYKIYKSYNAWFPCVDDPNDDD